MKLNSKVQQLVDKVEKGSLKTNVQKALMTLLMAKHPESWVARDQVKVPSATARIRELRNSRFGFKVEMKKEKPVKRGNKWIVPTFYRLDGKSVTVSKLKAVLEGVI